MEKVAVIGAGSWGTTLANMLAEKGYTVDLWVREEEVYQQIKQEGINRTFLPGMKLIPQLRPVQTFEEALRHKDIVLLVVPSHVFREILKGIKPYLEASMCLVSATKGIENDTLQIMSQVAETLLPGEYVGRFACLAGPSFAREVFVKRPTAVTIASRSQTLAERLQRVFSTEYFRVYTSQDVVGIQLCGAIKNVIAIAAGASDGLNFGSNARAALITRGLAEITRLGVTMGAHPLTFAGLAGMGDLVLTCTGDLSRNRTVGLKIGTGMSLEQITAGMTMVAEGIKTTLSVYELARKKEVDMPICTQVYEILYRGKDPREAVKDLMGRALKKEIEDDA
ncbi:MAG: NAD(P)H-dependent glycerol-3-phosphate dehydrogenase [Deltaproteobacteria bacterium]|nr:NAD(P)H-dependent glycerol-3-phosphate dehydrogenase [Deltaproteobacteria bacterium]MBW2136252.1 NAD(P)H-dependent glycerol-3-phosphate dehydrogenase [Deltaproteobacteria bacterium]